VLQRLPVLPRERVEVLPVRWGRGLATGYGVAATLALLAIAVLGDSTALTFSAALVSYWWLLPAPVLLVLAGVAAVLGARARLAAVAVVVPAVVCLVLQGPDLVHRLPGLGGHGPADLRVATYNITHGQPVDDVAQLVAEQHPAVLLLQEVTPERRADLQAALPAYRYVRFGPVTDGDGDAVLSTFPITGGAPVTGLPAGARATERVDVDVDGRDLAVLSVHLASPCLGCPGQGRFNPAGDTGRAAEVRLVEAHRYAQVVRQLRAQGRPVLLGGDLNSAPLNRPLHVLTGAGLTDVHRAVGTSPQLTRGPGPGVARVDAVLVAGLVPVGDAEGHRGASTHAPVVADLRWPVSAG
jgi:vancomycin resistance protein VanJ